MTWVKYEISFVTPASSVVLLMISNAKGDNGNDTVIDDIQLRICSDGAYITCSLDKTTVLETTTPIQISLLFQIISPVG
jgi:hypothetical protein